MTTVTVRASRPYEVTIGRGLLDTVGRQAPDSGRVGPLLSSLILRWRPST